MNATRWGTGDLKVDGRYVAQRLYRLGSSARYGNFVSSGLWTKSHFCKPTDDSMGRQKLAQLRKEEVPLKKAEWCDRCERLEHIFCSAGVSTAGLFQLSSGKNMDKNCFNLLIHSV